MAGMERIFDVLVFEWPLHHFLWDRHALAKDDRIAFKIELSQK